MISLKRNLVSNAVAFILGVIFAIGLLYASTLEIAIMDTAGTRCIIKAMAVEADKILTLDPTADPEIVATNAEDLIWHSSTKEWKITIDDSGVITTVEVP